MNATDTSTPVASRPGPLRRAWEWLWRDQALTLARAEQKTPGAVAYRRARIAAEVGDRILNPESPWLAGKAHHLAAGAFVEALGWALRGLAAPSEGSASSPGSDRPADRQELEQLMQDHASSLLQVVAGREQLERVRELALDRPFEASSYPAADAEVAARVLGRAVEQLLTGARAQLPLTEHILTQRWVRSGAVLLALLLAVSVKPIKRVWLEPRLDLAAGKPWRASSAAGENACTSPAQHCAAGRDFFFHTTDEQDPWLELDLTAPQRFSTVRVVNRQDCCAERAVPLVVEVSTDQRNWRVVAQQREAFDSWVSRFPTVSARWVRVRVVGRSTLHLYEVRVLP